MWASSHEGRALPPPLIPVSVQLDGAVSLLDEAPSELIPCPVQLARAASLLDEAPSELIPCPVQLARAASMLDEASSLLDGGLVRLIFFLHRFVFLTNSIMYALFCVRIGFIP